MWLGKQDRLLRFIFVRACACAHVYVCPCFPVFVNVSDYSCARISMRQQEREMGGGGGAGGGGEGVGGGRDRETILGYVTRQKEYHINTFSRTQNTATESVADQFVISRIETSLG